MEIIFLPPPSQKHLNWKQKYLCIYSSREEPNSLNLNILILDKAAADQKALAI